MADKQVGGSGEAGQATIGDSRKLKKGEVNFRYNEGVRPRRCGDCRFFVSGGCQIVEGDVKIDDICDEYEQNTKDGSVGSVDGATEARNEPVSQFEMFITRVTAKRGKRRWYSTSSGVKVDSYGEKMSTSLFDNFTARIERGDAPPAPFVSEAWQGGQPYLGLAHYLDLGGIGILGDTTKVYRDKETLKAKGLFRDTKYADAAFKAIQEDVATKRAEEERVRISIAFIDWGHNHGPAESMQFKRKSMSDRCLLCEAGVGNKEYTDGQLIHLALTRRPAYTETSIAALEERSMSQKRDDGASIIGELADDFEKKSIDLVGRSDTPSVDPKAIVIKSKKEGHDLDGALNLDEAEAYLERSEGAPVMLDSWDILSKVLENIIDDEKKALAVRAVVADFKTTLDTQTADAVVRIQKYLGGRKMAEENGKVERQVPPQFLKDEEEPRDRRPEEDEEELEGEVDVKEEPRDEEDEELEEKSHPLDEVFAAIKSDYDDVFAMPVEASDQRKGMLQKSLQTLADTFERDLSGPASAMDATTVQTMIDTAVSRANAPLLAEIAQLRERSAPVVTTPENHIPARRAINMPEVPSAPILRTADTPAPTPENPTPRLREVVRKSV